MTDLPRAVDGPIPPDSLVCARTRYAAAESDKAARFAAHLARLQARESRRDDAPEWDPSRPLAERTARPNHVQ